MLRKGVSFLLVLSMIVGLFTIVPVSAEAADTTTIIDSNEDYSIESAKKEPFVVQKDESGFAPVGATSTTEDGFVYSKDNNEIIICGYTGSAAEIVVPSEIDEISVTKIADSAFSELRRVNSINIPQSVVEIGHTVFKDDVTLKSVSLGGVRRLGWNVFEGCTSLKELTIPNTLTEVDNDYYYSQAPLSGSSIETVVFEDGIENIPSFVCAFAHALKSVTIPDKEDILDGYTIGEYAFYNTAISDIEFPDSVTEIHNNAFGETKLQKFSSGNSLEKICYSAFKGCVQLKELELNNGLKTIEDSAFEGCTRLAFVNIPNSVTEVGHTVFKDDVTLKSVSLGGVRRLGWNVFEGCTSLKELTIPNTLTEVDNDYYYSQAPLSGSSIETVVFEDGIENIPSFVCAFAHALKSVTIPEKRRYFRRLYNR